MNQTRQISSILAGMSNGNLKLRQESNQQLGLSRSSSATALRQKYGDAGNFLARCNPSFQNYYTGNPILAFKHDTPTLALVNQTFGKEIANAWLVPEIVKVSEFCGCKDKFTDEQLEDTVTLIASAYPWLKVSELLLFFGWLKLGRYGKFYGCLDPMVITTALQDFIRERSIYIDRLDQQKREKDAEEDRKKPRYTRAEWEEMKSKRE